MNEFCRIEMFGGLRVRQDDRLITRFRTQKAGALLAYLAYYPHQSHPREVLLEQFWPQFDPTAGRSNLSTTLSSLRHQLEPSGVPAGTFLVADRLTVQVNAALLSTDVADFEDHLKAAEQAKSEQERAQDLEAALETYAGPLLPGYYEEWILRERDRLAEATIQAVRRLVRHLVKAGDLPRALDRARQVVAADPLREEAHRDLMKLYIATGQPSAALQQYRDLERVLRQELEATPSAASRQIAQEIQREAPAEAARQAQEVREAKPPQGERQVRPAQAVNASALPVPFTRFFGRQAEIEQLCQRLLPPASQPATPSPRLVTLTGTGGMGKTRLALEAARRLVVAFAGAVWFVPLADLREAGQIPGALMAALRLPPTAQMAPLEQVIEALSQQPGLLVLDNYEHLVEGGARLVKALLERVPSLTVLVTSQQLLNLSGEREFPLSPLPIPPSTLPQPSLSPGGLTPEQLGQYASVQLFVDRAQAVKPDFQVTDSNAAAIAELCQRLEGLPLALELAASRAQILMPAQMLSQLEHRFEFLASRQRDLAQRHRTLRAAIDWSYQLLAPELQRFFAQLSVFRGGWTLETAEAVCGDNQVLDCLAQLRECSLVQTDDTARDGSEIRFGILETLREYGQERLQEAGQAAETRRRHRDWFYGLALEAERQYSSAEQAAWMERLDREYENLRAAFDGWLLDGEIEKAARMGLALSGFWEQRGRLREGREALARCLARQDAIPDRGCRAALLSTAGWFSHLLADYDQSLKWQQESLALCQELGDEEGQMTALNNLALTAQDQGRLAEARELFECSLALAQRRDDTPKQAARLSNLGLLAIQEGRYTEARDRLEAARALFETLNNAQGTAGCLCNLADLALRTRDWDTGRALSEQSLRLFRQLDDPRGIASSLANLAEVAARCHDHDAAEARSREALDICLKTGMRWLIPSLLETRARDLAARGVAAQSFFHLTAAAYLRERLGAPRSQEEQQEIDTVLAHLRLEEEIAFPIRTRLRTLTLEEILAQALEPPQPQH